MGETSALVGCLAQNLHAGPRWCLLEALIEAFGCSWPCCWVQDCCSFSNRLFFFFSCVWQNMGKRHLQSVCNPWLEGAVSASESPCGGCGGGSLQISSSPCFCKEGDWPVFLAGRVLFQVQGDHQALVSPGSHQDGGFQELHKTCILPHVQKCSFICSSFSPTALGGAGRWQCQETK